MESKGHIGEGIYTVPDMARVFGLPNAKVRRWVKDYWDARLTDDKLESYSWTDGNSRAVNFLTLIELHVYIQLLDAGVTTKAVLKAHRELSQQYQTHYPFANNVIIEGLRADGNKISFESEQGIYTLDGTQQFKFKFYKNFIQKLDFGADDLALRYWPKGRKSSVVMNPDHQFGQPVINGTNIVIDSIYSMYKAGDNIAFIAHLFDVKQSEVKDAIEFFEAA